MQQQGKVKEAESLFREALGKCPELRVEAIADRSAVDNFGLRQVFSEFLDQGQAKLGDGHPATLDTVNNLGLLLLKDLQQHEEAESLLREALGKRRELGCEVGDAQDCLHAAGYVCCFYAEQSFVLRCCCFVGEPVMHG